MSSDVLKVLHRIVRPVRTRHEQLSCFVKLLRSRYEEPLGFVFFSISNMRVGLIRTYETLGPLGRALRARTLSIDGSSFSLGSSMSSECSNGTKSRGFTEKPRTERSQPASTRLLGSMNAVADVKRYKTEKIFRLDPIFFLQDTLGARDIRSPCSFYRLP